MRQSDHADIDISIVIVNYNVKEFVANLLNSISKARYDFKLQIIVVDNDSSDDSLEYLEPRYPDVQFIANDENVGFGKANNQALKQANGRYTLLINPDTIVSEDTLSTLFRHMEMNPSCGACGCKILNPDGSFAPESRRSIPTIWSSLSKLLGLSALFPNSKTFGQYYMSWMDEDEPGQIPVLSGSFMFFRTDVLKQLKGFDERFFMYGEDIDLCYRLQKTGYHIDYVPDTSIIHYKGESTKKDNIRYIKSFNEALYIFFKKHYTHRYSSLFRSVIFIGIVIRGLFSFLKNKFSKYKSIVFDLLVLNVLLFIAFPIRYENVGFGDMFSYPQLQFWTINGLVSVFYLFFSNNFGIVRRRTYSVVGSLKAVLATYAVVVLITFFIRSLAFSRIILLGSSIASVFIIGFIRLIRKNSHKNPEQVRGKLTSTRILIVGLGEKTHELIEKIHSRIDWDYEIVGIVSQQRNTDIEQINNIPLIGTLEQLPELVAAYKIDQVHFMLHSISYKDILHVMPKLKNRNVVLKLVPDELDFILGKSNVEYLADIPLVDLEMAYQSATNKFVKRTFELIVTIPIFLMMSLLVGPLLLITNTKKKEVTIPNANGSVTLNLYYPFTHYRVKNFYLLLIKVLIGDLHLVGAPLLLNSSSSRDFYEYGLTGLSQINSNRIYSDLEQEKFDLYYLQNYSIWMDIDILAKTIVNGPDPLAYLQEQLDEK